MYMKKGIYYFYFALILTACKEEAESVSPSIETITESVYASGTIESEDQYQVFPSANGIIQNVHISEGDYVNSKSALFTIFNETSRINRQNAELNAKYSDINSNSSKINDLKLSIDLAKNKMLNDSLMLVRQKILFEKDVIPSTQLEQSQLTYLNSKTSFLSSQLKLRDLQKQLNLSDKQSKNNLLISSQLENDFVVKSDIKGKVYSILKKKGESVNMQTPIAIIGDAEAFKIILQVDEYDIIKVKKGMKIIILLDSYKGKTFEAVLTKIDPIMNERSKTFTVEAVFTKKPPVLYPNLSLEANIIIQTRQNIITIPRKFFINDQFVVLKNGNKKSIKTGLKDYQKIEVISGLNKNDILIIPVK
jgi:HlyD family secretion protein